MDEASWFPCEGSNYFTVSHSPFNRQLIFLLSCPCPHQQELLLPFHPSVLGMLFWEERCFSPLVTRGVGDCRSHQPQRGMWSWGKWSWWGRVGREIRQQLDLCEGPSETALLGMLTFLRDAHRLDSYTTNQMGWAATVNEGIWDGVLHVTGTRRPHTPAVFAEVSMGLSSGTGLVTASGTPESPTQDTNRGECGEKPHTQTQRWCTELGNKPLL